MFIDQEQDLVTYHDHPNVEEISVTLKKPFSNWPLSVIWALHHISQTEDEHGIVSTQTLSLLLLVTHG